MKRLFIIFFALCATTAAATTTVPVQLLNPTGSSSGLAIVSTGASSAPAWGGVGLNGIAAIGANTVLTNATASSAAPTAFSMPSCSTSASALNWTTSTGFTCNTAVNAATLGGQTFTSPTITTPNIQGVTNGATAAAGQVGQLIPSSASAISVTSGTPTNCTSVSLAAGDWDVWGNMQFSPGASTVQSSLETGLSATSATLPAVPYLADLQLSFGAGLGQSLILPKTTFNVTTTTTVYAVAQATFTTSTETVSCQMAARRMH